jgi:hypothetical protein
MGIFKISMEEVKKKRGGISERVDTFEFLDHVFNDIEDPEEDQ